MVTYIVRCRDYRDAKAVESAFKKDCSTPVFCRVLERLQDLDAYDADLISTSEDGRTLHGSLAFGRHQRASDASWHTITRWTMLIVGAVALAVAFGVRLFGNPAQIPSTTIGTFLALLLLTVAALGLLAARVTGRISPERRVFRYAVNWLKKQRPVVIAASEELLDLSCVPRGAMWFYRAPEGPRRKSVRRTA